MTFYKPLLGFTSIQTHYLCNSILCINLIQNSTIGTSSFSINLNFGIVELQKRGISLIILRKRARCWIFCAKRAFAHFGLNSILSLFFFFLGLSYPRLGKCIITLANLSIVVVNCICCAIVKTLISILMIWVNGNTFTWTRK